MAMQVQANVAEGTLSGGFYFMSFGIYMVGFVILIVGLALGANMMHVPAQWIAIGVVVMIGLGIVLGVKNTRQRDSSQ